MGDSHEHRGGHAAEEQLSISISIGRLLVYTGILLFAAITTGLLLFCTHRDQGRRVVRASELAEDRLERLVAERNTLRAGAFEAPDEEVIVSPGGRERYSRVVAIDPAAPADGAARVTVTVAWETLTGESRVRMCARLDATEPGATGGEK